MTKGNTLFRSHTATVPATRGVAFGFVYRLDGVPTDHSVRLTQIIRQLPMRKPDGTVIRRQVSYQDVAPNDGGYVEGKLWYILREDYEVVPGDWTISLLHGSTVLLKQRFKVAS